MTDDREQQDCEIIQFSRRPVPPRACVVENRIHVRMFLADMLDEMGFIAREADTTDIRATVRDFRPNAIILGPLDAGPCDLEANLDRFLPVQPPPLPVDVDEALCNGWLELWYQSKIDAQSLVPRGADALVRVHHPT